MEKERIVISDYELSTNGNEHLQIGHQMIWDLRTLVTGKIGGPIGPGYETSNKKYIYGQIFQKKGESHHVIIEHTVGRNNITKESKLIDVVHKEEECLKETHRLILKATRKLQRKNPHKYQITDNSTKGKQ